MEENLFDKYWRTEIENNIDNICNGDWSYDEKTGEYDLGEHGKLSKEDVAEIISDICDNDNIWGTINIEINWLLGQHGVDVDDEDEDGG